VQSVHTVGTHTTVRGMIDCRLNIVTVSADPSESFSLQKQSANIAREHTLLREAFTEH
jgi:hypothetical protein